MTQPLDRFFAALADPTRRRVMERFSLGPASVSELHNPQAMALPTFLRHLRVLEDSGLVRSDKTGRVRTVHIDPAGLVPATEWLDRQRQQLLDRVDRLQALAEELDRATAPNQPRPPRSAP